MEERGRWRRDDHWYVGKGKMVGVGRWEVGGRGNACKEAVGGTTT